MRNDLLERVRTILARAGYFVTRISPFRSTAFDLVARRDDQLLVVKVLTNVDSLSEGIAREMGTLSRFLEANPILVGERSSSRPLEDGAVYIRHSIPIVTYPTLEEYISTGATPLVYAAPGGFYVFLDGQKLRRIREERGISLGQLADVAGVSRRAISMYEEGMSAMVEVAARIEEFLGDDIVRPLDPFSGPRKEEPPAPEPALDLGALSDGLEREILRAMEGLGFRIAAMEKGPFDAMAKEERVILTGVAEPSPDLPRKAAFIANIAQVTETFGAFFVERRTTRIEIEGIPLIGKEELARLREPSDVVALIRERRKPPAGGP